MKNLVKDQINFVSMNYEMFPKHTIFEHEFVLVLEKKKNPANQNTVLNTHFVLIGQIWSTSLKIILGFFLTVRLDIDLIYM